MVVNNLSAHLDWLQTSGAFTPGQSIRDAVSRARHSSSEEKSSNNTITTSNTTVNPPGRGTPTLRVSASTSQRDKCSQKHEQLERIPSLEIISPPEHESDQDQHMFHTLGVPKSSSAPQKSNASPHNAVRKNAVEQYIDSLQELRKIYEAALAKHKVTVPEAARLRSECDSLRMTLNAKSSTLLEQYCDEDPNFFDITDDEPDYPEVVDVPLELEREAIPDTDYLDDLGPQAIEEAADIVNIADSDTPHTPQRQNRRKIFQSGDRAHPLELSSPETSQMNLDWSPHNHSDNNANADSISLSSSPTQLDITIESPQDIRASSRALTAAELENFMDTSDEEDDNHILITEVHKTVKRFAWSNEVDQVLHNVFGLRSFRSNQLEAVNATLQGNDVFVLMPTGGGKSLCYQLPALVQSGKTSGPTIVISPLISLMQDQVRALKEKNIRAEYINSSCSRAEKNKAMSMLVSGGLDLLYFSPEMLNLNSEMKRVITHLHDSGKLARFVIDEAHCISQWGHDFRPDYRTLVNLQREFPQTPIMALTATANLRVSKDILGCLRPSNRVTFKQSFNRPNLTYFVRPKPGSSILYNEIAALISKHKSGSGIIYCATQQHCQNASQKLSDLGFAVNYYHAGLTNDEREHAQKQWQSGAVKAVFATTAFGMGIDKADVRFVVHLTLPRTMEGYYQETGRAGRDGQPSECVLYYSFKDVSQLERLIKMDRSLKYEDRQHQIEFLGQVKQYCENKVDCRRKQILQYFNEPFPPEQCHKTCDNCATDSKRVQKDLTTVATQIVKMVKHIEGSNVTLPYCVGVFRGSKIRKIMDCGHNNAPHYGAGAGHLKSEVERIFQRLIGEKYLQEVAKRLKSGFSTSYLRTGPMANKLIKGQVRVVVDFDVIANDPPPYSQVFNKHSSPVVSHEIPATLASKSTSASNSDLDLWNDELRPPSRRPLTPVEYNAPFKKPRMITKPAPVSKTIVSHNQLDPDSEQAQILYGELEVRRSQIQARYGASRPGDICTDTALEKLSTQCPQTLDEFEQIAELSSEQRQLVYAQFRMVIKKFLNEHGPASSGTKNTSTLPFNPRNFTYKM